MKIHFHRAQMLVFLMSLTPGFAQGDVGEVIYWESIDDGQVPGLGLGAEFGMGLASIGDLNNDGVSDLAVGSPEGFIGGTPPPGSVWILLMQADGSVSSSVRITQNTGGFGGPILDNTGFGWEVAPLGDVDGDDVPDIAVGQPFADDGGTNRGAIWILRLNTDGTVKSNPAPTKISSTSGNFGLGLQDQDQFGWSIAAIGDLDQDGTDDLLVGALGDDEGGPDRGAAWVLFLKPDGSVDRKQKVNAPAGTTDGAVFGSSAALLEEVPPQGGGAITVAVGARREEGQGAIVDPGAVWILSLDQDGLVTSQLKISRNQGGFLENLDDSDAFGWSIANLGDLDGSGPGVTAMAVGAAHDDDGGANRGAVWIVFLDSLGAVISSETIKISSTSGGFGGSLQNEGSFGAGACSLGDLDGDGRTDLAIGAPVFDSGQGPLNTGRVWVLFLNDGTLPMTDVTVWNGSQDQDWFDSSNWSGAGVPNQFRTAIIPANVPQFPQIDGNAECRHLWIRQGASLHINAGPIFLDIYEGITLLGPVTGPSINVLRFQGDGTVSGTGSVAVAVQFTASADVTFQGGPLTLLNNLTTSSDVTVRAGAQIVVQGFAQFNSPGTLAGAGTMDLNGPTTIRMVSTSPPILLLRASLVVNGALFTPSSGSIVFDGTLPQTVTVTNAAEIQLHDVEVASTASVSFSTNLRATGDVRCEGDATVLGDAEFDGIFEGSNPSSNMTTSGGGNLDIGGPVFCYGGVVTVDGTVFVTSSGPVTLDVPNGFGVAVDVMAGSTVTIENTMLDIDGPLTIFSGIVTSAGDLQLTVPSMVIEGPGEFAVASNRVGLLADAPLTVRGELSVGGGGELALSANPISVLSGGTLHVVGDPGSPARVTGGEGGGYAVTLGTGSTAATLEASRFVFQEMGTDGVRVEGSASFGGPPMDLRDGTFDLVAAGGVLLNIQPRAALAVFERLRFEDSAGTGVANPGTTFNVRTAIGGMPVLLKDWTGSYGGPLYEDDPGGLGLWGTELVFFTVRDKSDRNIVRWLTESAPNVLSYIVERAPQSGGSFVQIAGSPVTAVNAPTLYRLVDTAIVPGTAYFYRLSEEFNTVPPIINEIGIVAVDGIPNLLTPVLLPTPPAASGSTPPPSGPRDALAGANGADGRFVDVALPRGLYAPFAWRANGDQHLLVMSAGDAVIDVSEEPVRIAGVGEGASVHLNNLLLDLDGRAGPALIVEESEGMVLLDRIRVIGHPEGSLLGSSASALVLQDGALPVLELVHGSRAHAIGAAIGTSRVSRDSTLERFAEPPERLKLVDADTCEIDAPPGSTWQLFASFDLAYRDHPGVMPFVLDATRMSRLGIYHAIAPGGGDRARLRLPPALDKLDRPLYLQALVRNPGSRERAASTVITARER